jgi:NADP-dependent 3-hydroxy acid dehydrogenase YdfG
MTTGYEGRVILVTGANSGIGEAIAVAFQQTVATVFGLARRREALEAARARHPQIHWRRGDVTDAIKARTAVENAVGNEKRVSIYRQTRNDGVRGRLTRRRSGSMKEVKIVATA